MRTGITSASDSTDINDSVHSDGAFNKNPTLVIFNYPPGLLVPASPRVRLLATSSASF